MKCSSLKSAGYKIPSPNQKPQMLGGQNFVQRQQNFADFQSTDMHTKLSHPQGQQILSALQQPRIIITLRKELVLNIYHVRQLAKQTGKMKVRSVTLGMAPGWTLFSALHRTMPFLSPSWNSSSEGSSGRSFAHTTPTVFRNQLAASCLLIAALNDKGNKFTYP